MPLTGHRSTLATDLGSLSAAHGPRRLGSCGGRPAIVRVCPADLHAAPGQNPRRLRLSAASSDQGPSKPFA